MLDDDLREAIEDKAAHYAERRAACIDALKLVQRRHRWVSDEHLREVADLLDMSAEDLDGVASFYNLIFRKPVGEHVILACDSVSCWMLGADAVADKLKDHLGIDFGETTDDDQFTLLPICCLGDCDHAPALMIDEDLHHDVDPAQIRDLLARYGGS